MKRRRQLEKVARWAGAALGEDSYVALREFARWLVEEATPAGGLGPAEGPRVWERHVVESVLFSPAVPSIGTVIDVGSGVGLPAIPLAILHPGVVFVALDRSQRRIDLLIRARRVLHVDNLEPLHADVDEIAGPFDGMTSRATAGIEQTMARAVRLLRPGGVAVMGVSRTDTAVRPVDHPFLDIEMLSVPVELLDAPLTLLRMVRRVEQQR